MARKGFWKNVNPLVWGAFAIGGWLLIKRQAEKTAEESVPHLFQTFEKAVPTSGIVIPSGKTWIVKLKDNRQVTMNSVQLQQAIDAKAVKTYQLAKRTA